LSGAGLAVTVSSLRAGVLPIVLGASQRSAWVSGGGRIGVRSERRRRARMITKLLRVKPFGRVRR
jgi:hypothetical protein